MRFVKITSIILLFSLIITGPLACSGVSRTKGAQAGPDKSAIGVLLGAGWGAGAGAILGNQFGASGPGIAIGAGIGAVNGLLVGMGLDVLEGNQLQTERDIAVLRMHTAENSRRLDRLENENTRVARATLDEPFMAVYFDPGRASLRIASIEQLAHLAEGLRRKRPGTYLLKMRGFSSDLGDPKENENLISARLLSVENVLRSHGIPSSAIILDNAPSDQRAASLVVSERGGQKVTRERLNNRVEVIVSIL
ncbi:MAG TPA: hypothetical protein PKA63_08665 [Oligoflexia bacterium]|nr:hypothetical protein [Oligoflexia bacterium]HMP48723.1 hypothetical protein [Oligoflexia bacterium]